ncbi:glycosyltransferase [Nocardioides marmoraquaticus]
MIVFSQRSYDFDESVADGLSLIHLNNRWQLLPLMLRHRVREVEVNEPLMLNALRTTVTAVIAARVAGVVLRRRVRIGTYAIANDDALGARSARLRSRWRRLAYHGAVRLALRTTDRIVFGTEEARAQYEALGVALPRASALVPAISAPCQCGRLDDERDPVLVFLGAFDDRKGLLPLLSAWPEIARQVPTSRLVVIGQGAHLGRAAELARRRDDVEIVLDPPRVEIHRRLRAARAVVLYSRSTPTWREQVGLPLVEGLSHGCEVVASDETGIAGWLGDHGHGVAATADGEPGLIRAVVVALTSGRAPSTILADLPDVDGRVAADHWLWSSSGD